MHSGKGDTNREMTHLEMQSGAILRGALHGKYFGLSHSLTVQLLSHVRLFATPWTAACQASLSTNSQSLLKLMSIK